MLAEAGATTFPQLVTPLLGATVPAVVLWLVALLVVAFATRPRDIDPGPATMDLGEEPPAVVDLLTNDWRVTADAIPATLLDLAARDFVDLEQYGPGRTVCRIRRAAADGLETYERMVLDHVAGLAVDGIVPAEALTTGPQDQSTRWWRAFQRRVVRDARERGLTRDRWSSPVKALLRLAALVPAGLGVLLANAAGGLDLGTIGVGLAIWALLTSSMKLFRDQRDTPAGAAAAARWLGVRSYLGRNEVFPTLPPASVAVWDRYLGYGAALGVATAALQALPMGAEDDHRAWSAYGGRWRMVKVRYPRLSFIWGRKPAIAILVGLAVAGAGYGVLRLMLGLRDWADGFTEADQAAGWVQAAAAVLAVTAVLVAAWGVWTMLRAVLDLVSRQQVEGQVVRRRTYSRGNNKSDHYLGVDSGRLDKVKAWLVPAGVYDRFREGSLVKATIGPRLGHVFQVDLVSGSRATAPPLPAMVEAAEMPAVPGSDQGVGTAAVLTAGLDGMLASPGIEVDPAKMVTAEDAGLALGTPVAPARPLFEQPLPVGRMRGCEYRAASGSGSVSVFTAAGDLVKLLVHVNRRFGDSVPGIGDQAFIRGDTVAVVRGDTAVVIRLQGGQVGDRTAALRRLAAAAVGRLAAASTQAPA
ncbi:MAG TPA: hypothetical protein VK942_00095 [Actinomycetes bacterium]|nr:hypothetical protein [Actinomycetes bacterium]